MQQYLDILKDTVENGIWVKNSRTGVNCLTSLNHTIKLDCSTDEFPIVTTRRAFWKQAINEMVCYIRGYHLKDDFHKLGVHTWDANIEAWNNLDYNSQKNNAGIIYGRSAKEVGIDYQTILTMIENTPTDRGIIWNFWNPEYFDKGCLRPCMYSHQFNVLGDTLHLTSTQRSCDLPLGSVFNIIQVWFLLKITAQLTGLKAGTATLNMVNCHIYENQLELVKEQLKRIPFQPPTLTGIENITLNDLMIGTVTDKLQLNGYNHHEPIRFPFTA